MDIEALAQSFLDKPDEDWTYIDPEDIKRLASAVIERGTMTQDQAAKLKILAEAYLKLLILSRSDPNYMANDTLAQLRDGIVDLYKADPEYVQNSFELVADTMRQ